MAYLNRIEIIGNLGKDPVSVTLPNGTQKVSFSVAVSKKFRTKTGEQKEQTNWFKAVFLGKLAETIGKLNLSKGISVFVSGEMNIRNYTDQDGHPRTATEINGDTLQVLTPRSGSATAQAQPSEQYEDLPF